MKVEHKKGKTATKKQFYLTWYILCVNLPPVTGMIPGPSQSTGIYWDVVLLYNYDIQRTITMYVHTTQQE